MEDWYPALLKSATITAKRYRIDSDTLIDEALTALLRYPPHKRPLRIASVIKNAAILLHNTQQGIAQHLQDNPPVAVDYQHTPIDQPALIAGLCQYGHSEQMANLIASGNREAIIKLHSRTPNLPPLDNFLETLKTQLKCLLS